MELPPPLPGGFPILREEGKKPAKETHSGQIKKGERVQKGQYHEKRDFQEGEMLTLDNS